MAITRTGSVYQASDNNNNGGGDVTIPADATLFVIGYVGCIPESGYITTPTLDGTPMSLGYLSGNTSGNNVCAIWYTINPPTGVKAFAFDWANSSPPNDGGQFIWASYKGNALSDVVRDSDGGQVADHTKSVTISASNGDMVYSVGYGWNDPSTPNLAWTNATDVSDVIFNDSVAGAAESFPSGNVTITVEHDGGSGSYPYTTLGCVCFKYSGVAALSITAYDNVGISESSYATSGLASQLTDNLQIGDNVTLVRAGWWIDIAIPGSVWGTISGPSGSWVVINLPTSSWSDLSLPSSSWSAITLPTSSWSNI